ncbi:hypothetical protein LJC20_06960 [Eubacteriales bacterium OttesenSCG-928-M02]|nr:hypothetical protein [Eubacteriales bacterium OttesenSCG-928-M02]
MEKGNSAIGMHIINRVVICIDAYRDQEIEGRILYHKDTVVVPFFDINQLMAEMEHFFDDISYPQAAMEHRSFLKKGGKGSGEGQPQTAEAYDATPKGRLATFAVQVQFRQNASWQGRMEWVEGQEVQPFRSELELLHHIDTVLSR